ncbi:hypothetical protein PR048_030240 [Dryococelus australis]|uniref:Uncharacterized protein n=1 Tax=Dryococelus australis TaxID=614101 RepID=A0ABQ9G8F2_9NEOP|nr:hypothetical protein PR048_030240 [Dryococelus australis]
MKKKARKESAREKLDLFKTGGGTVNPIKSDPVLDKVRKVIGVSIDGLYTSVHCDVEYTGKKYVVDFEYVT